MNRLKATIPVF